MRKADTGPAVIVFGYNEHRIPQASWFSEAEADLAVRAARLMGLRVLRIENEAHRELAARLRQGQVYAADRTFAPAVQREIFDKLSELAGPVGAASPVEITASKDDSRLPPGQLGGHQGWRSRHRPRKPRGRLVGSHRRSDRERPVGPALARLRPDPMRAPGPLGGRPAAPGRCRAAPATSRLTNPGAGAIRVCAPLSSLPPRPTPAAQGPPPLGSGTCVCNSQVIS